MKTENNSVIIYVIFTIVLSINAEESPTFHPQTHHLNIRSASNATNQGNPIPSTQQQQPNSTDDCCPPIYLSPQTVSQAPDDLCTKECIDGLTIVGLKCRSDQPKSGDWGAIVSYFKKVTLIKSHFHLNGLVCDSFLFLALKTIKATHVIIEGYDVTNNFFKSLETIQPESPHCDIVVSTKGFPAGPDLTKFNAALSKGKNDCLAALPTTSTATTAQCPTTSAMPTCPPPVVPTPQTVSVAAAVPLSGSPNTSSPSQSAMNAGAAAVKNNNHCSKNQTCASFFVPFVAVLVTFGIFLLIIMSLFIICLNIRRNQKKALMYTIVHVMDGSFKSAHKLLVNYKNAKLVDGQVMECPADKNRHLIVCLKDTRVVLAGKEDGDFIHANFVDVPDHDKRFIATQGPLFNTIYDFWYMVVQELCEHVIKVTDNAEIDHATGEESTKCKEYYPIVKGETMSFKLNDTMEPIVEVTCKRSVLVKFGKSAQIRKTILSIQFPGTKKKVQKVTVWHYLNWPDHAVPLDDGGALVEILYATLQSKNPIVVHCSAGIGRTGAVIMAGYIMSQMRDGQKVDDPITILNNLRKGRAGLVKKKAQFLFALQVIFVHVREYCGLDADREKAHDNFTVIYEELAKDCILAADEERKQEGEMRKQFEKEHKDMKKKKGKEAADVVPGGEAGVIPADGAVVGGETGAVPGVGAREAGAVPVPGGEPGAVAGVGAGPEVGPGVGAVGGPGFGAASGVGHGNGFEPGVGPGPGVAMGAGPGVGGPGFGAGVQPGAGAGMVVVTGFGAGGGPGQAPTGFQQ